MSTTDFDLRGWLGALLTHLHLNPGLDGVFVAKGYEAEVQLTGHQSQAPDTALLLERWMWSMSAVEHVQAENVSDDTGTYVRLTMVGELITGHQAKVWVTYRGEHAQTLLDAAEDGRLDIGVFSHVAAGKGNPTARPAAEQAPGGDEDQAVPLAATAGIRRPGPDPLARIGAGAPASAAGPIGTCGTQDPETGYVCTRRSHPAEWQHIATDGIEVMATWSTPDEDQATPVTFPEVSE